MEGLSLAASSFRLSEDWWMGLEWLNVSVDCHLIVSSDPTDESPHQIATVAGLLSFSLADRGFAGSPALHSLRRLHRTSHSSVLENCRVMQMVTVLL
ncbi:hypothetical protein BLNAU_17631 [Blattamonas nauphoetae]|uniref:Uncharacterized protein n=1 Tax=Blattamonas nauphoetae TaxID=2049346 RepID=A0ABQ9XAX7_9EUKA|nr:hypothetical protein BLNAU_17631 [Blattamonas nauphoetae]